MGKGSSGACGGSAAPLVAAAKKGEAWEVAEFGCWRDFFLEEEPEDCCYCWIYYNYCEVVGA